MFLILTTRATTNLGVQNVQTMWQTRIISHIAVKMKRAIGQKILDSGEVLLYCGHEE